MMKWTRALIVVIGIFVLVIAAKYVCKNIDSFRRILDINVVQVCVFVFLQVISLVINGCILVVIFRAFDARLSYSDGFHLASMNTFLNYLVVKGGIFANGYFLKKVHRVSYADFMVSMWAFMLINIMMSGIIGMMFLAFRYITTGNFSVYMFLIFLILSTAVFSIIRFSTAEITPSKPQGFLMRKVDTMLNSWKTLRGKNGVIFWLLVLSFLNFATYALRLKYGFHVLFGGMSFAGCMIISIVSILSTLVSVTPGAIGIREFLMGSAYSLIDGNMIDAVVVATLDRAISIFVVFILGIISCVYYFKQSSIVSKAL